MKMRIVQEPTSPQPAAPNPTATIAVAAFVIGALYFGREMFIPLALAVLLSFALSPIVVALRRFRVPRAPAVLLVVVLAFTVIATLGTIMGRQLAELAAELPRYEVTLRSKIQGLQGPPGAPAGVIERAAEALEGLSRELERKQPDKQTTPSERSSETESKPIPVEIHNPPPKPLEYYHNLISPMLEPLARMGLVVLLVGFILMQREDLRDRFIRLFGGDDFERTTTAMTDAAERLSRLFLTLTVMNIIYGAAMGVALWVIGIPNPILWGILAGLMRYVPYIGSVIAALFPVLLAAAVDPGWSMFAITLAVYVIGEFTMGQILEPWLLGTSTGLTPLAVIASASFWTWLWGPIGLLLAIPLTVCLIVLGRHVPQLNFLYVMLGDQPALTPSQRFYQRLLAGDIDEITFDAEKFLKKDTLINYFDVVAVPALVLAQADAKRGRFTPDRMNEMQEMIAELIDELDDYDLGSAKKKDDKKNDPDEAEPDPPVLTPETLKEDWRGEAPVLSIAMRNPLEHAAAGILAHLVRKHGIGVQLLEAQALTPTAMTNLDLESARVAVLSNLDSAPSEAYERFLIRRMRRRQPDLPIWIGTWGIVERGAAAGDDVANVKRMPSLRATVAALVAAAQLPLAAETSAETPAAALDAQEA